MLRIIVIGINYAPEQIGIGKYTAEMCEWLVARGHKVRIICAPPYYPDWKIRSGYAGVTFRKEVRNGVEIIRCPTWVPRKPTGIKRMLHLASFAMSAACALVYSLSWKADWVINISPALVTAPLASSYAKKVGAKSWLHFQDFEFDAAFQLGFVKNAGLLRLLLILERQIIKSFNVVSTISDAMRERLLAKGAAHQHLASLRNWVDIESITPLQHLSAFRSELGIPHNAVVALYSGNMGIKQGLETLVAAAALIGESENVCFVLAGEGPAKESVVKACADLNNVRIVGLQPTPLIGEWLGMADIHLLPQSAEVADLVMPSKLTGMLASGRPVIATAHGETAVARALEHCGVVTPPSDAHALAEAIRSLATDNARRKELGKAARAYAVANLSRESILKEFESNLTPS